MSIVNYEIIDHIGVIRLNNPPVNALSHALRTGLMQVITKAQSDDSRCLLILCEGRTFIAGADITEFGKPPQSPSLPDVLQVIESSRKPVLAAIHGTALGGGFETALACHYRCALASARIGLPEVKLGLLPGAGGTQRVPRLAGIKVAMNLMTSGKPVSASYALEHNLIDRVITETDLLEGAMKYASEIATDTKRRPLVRDLKVDPTSVAQDYFSVTRQTLKRKMKGQIAPQHIVSCIEAAVTKPFDQGLEIERDLFLQCMQSNESSAMRHIFFAERGAAKIKGFSKNMATQDIKEVAIIGGGTMGGGIAMNFANAGMPVRLLEINDEALAKGIALIEKNYSISVKKGKLSEKQKQQALSMIKGTTDYDSLKHADLVIEAVFESMDIKKQVFKKLDTVCKKDAILATNTSYLDINEIANVTQRPCKVIGLHFFSPANIMKLLEIVRGHETDEDVIANMMKLAKRIKKIPVLSGVCYGFIGNRMLRQYASEAQLCLLEGATPEDIDHAMQDWGMAMGPLAVGDLAGLDIGYKARLGLSEDEKGNPMTFCIPDALVEMGRLGQKSSAGYYTYDPATRERSSDPAVLDLIVSKSKEFGIHRKSIDPENIVLRLIFALINEGAKILEEGIAQRSSDIDVVYVYGYGFPAFRGGPMYYADTLGLDTVYKTLLHFSLDSGKNYWQPAPLIKKLALSGQGFSDWAKDQ